MVEHEWKAQAKYKVGFVMRGWEPKVNHIMFSVVFTAKDCIVTAGIKSDVARQELYAPACYSTK